MIENRAPDFNMFFREISETDINHWLSVYLEKKSELMLNQRLMPFYNRFNELCEFEKWRKLSFDEEKQKSSAYWELMLSEAGSEFLTLESKLSGVLKKLYNTVEELGSNLL